MTKENEVNELANPSHFSTIALTLILASVGQGDWL